WQKSRELAHRRAVRLNPAYVGRVLGAPNNTQLGRQFIPTRHSGPDGGTRGEFAVYPDAISNSARVDEAHKDARTGDVSDDPLPLAFPHGDDPGIRSPTGGTALATVRLAAGFPGELPAFPHARRLGGICLLVDTQSVWPLAAKAGNENPERCNR